VRKERELCRPCWQRALHRRRFDLVAMNLDKKSLFIPEEPPIWIQDIVRKL